MKTFFLIAALLIQQTISDIQPKTIQKGVISGRIQAPDGSADASLVSIALMRYRYDESGHWHLANVPGIAYPPASVSVVRLNDRGEFRFYDLAAGDYYIKVNGFPYGKLKPKIILDSYFPGTADESMAQPVHVEPGDDIQLGTMLFQEADAVEVLLRFIDGDDIHPTFRKVAVGDYSLNYGSSSEVRFPLKSGHYNLRITSDGSYAQVNLDVGTSNIEQEVLMRPAVVVRAHVYHEDDQGGLTPYVANSLDFSCRMDSLTSKESSLCQQRGVVFYIGDGVHPGASTTPPDRYRLSFPHLPANTYVRSATISGHDVLREPIPVNSDTDMDIVLSPAAALIRGIVRDAAGEKLPDAVIALVPDGSLRSAMDLYRSVVSDANGAFQIQGIAPGDYHLFAWPDLQGAAYRNTEFMKKYDDKGVPLKIEKASQINQDLSAL